MTDRTRTPILAPHYVAVIAGYADGLAAREIADKLGISERAVYWRTAEASRILGIRGARQSALVDRAFRHGYLTPSPRRLRPLPPRLIRVLDCAARGLSCKATAAELHIAERTAARHRTRLLEALDVHSAAHAVAVAWHAGLLGTPEQGSTK